MILFDVDSPVERRALLRRAGAVAALLPLGGLLSACGEVEAGANGDEPSGSGSAASDGASSGVDQASAGSAGSVLVTYFSATGNTAGIASAVVEHLGANTFEISPAQPYADADLNYNDDGSRVSQERASDARPELSQDIPDGFADYDIVFLGYPIWWGEAAWPLRTFVEANDFSGKVVVPFCTSASSGIGGSGEALAELAGAGDWREGSRFSGSAPTVDVADWVDGLGL